VKKVLSMIVERHPSMSKFGESGREEARRRQLVVAVNSRLAKLSDTVHDGDRVSLLLPVIGGSEE
jgi:molybdopterin converting factor small subunit